jgi:copper chaperone
MEKIRGHLHLNAMSMMITVEGMSCNHCEETVEEALEGVTGVRKAEADHSADQVTVDGDSDLEDLVAAVEAAGYDASA